MKSRRFTTSSSIIWKNLSSFGTAAARIPKRMIQSSTSTVLSAGSLVGGRLSRIISNRRARIRKSYDYRSKANKQLLDPHLIIGTDVIETRDRAVELLKVQVNRSQEIRHANTTSNSKNGDKSKLKGVAASLVAFKKLSKRQKQQEQQEQQQEEMKTKSQVIQRALEDAGDDAILYNTSIDVARHNERNPLDRALFTKPSVWNRLKSAIGITTIRSSLNGRRREKGITDEGYSFSSNNKQMTKKNNKSRKERLKRSKSFQTNARSGDNTKKTHRFIDWMLDYGVGSSDMGRGMWKLSVDAETNAMNTARHKLHEEERKNKQHKYHSGTTMVEAHDHYYRKTIADVSHGNVNDNHLLFNEDVGYATQPARRVRVHSAKYLRHRHKGRGSDDTTGTAGGMRSTSNNTFSFSLFCKRLFHRLATPTSLEMQEANWYRIEAEVSLLSLEASIAKHRTTLNLSELVAFDSQWGIVCNYHKLVEIAIRKRRKQQNRVQARMKMRKKEKGIISDTHSNSGDDIDHEEAERQKRHMRKLRRRSNTENDLKSFTKQVRRSISQTDFKEYNDTITNADGTTITTTTSKTSDNIHPFMNDELDAQILEYEKWVEGDQKRSSSNHVGERQENFGGFDLRNQTNLSGSSSSLDNPKLSDITAGELHSLVLPLKDSDGVKFLPKARTNLLQTIYETILSSHEIIHRFGRTNATNSEVGVEIVRQFVLDILGRTTPQAKIFANKTSTDMARKRMVSMEVKYITIVFVVLLNIYFLLSCIAYASMKKESWQYNWLLLVVAGIFLDFVFVATLEASLIGFYIPNLIRKHILGVEAKLANSSALLTSLLHKQHLQQKLAELDINNDNSDDDNNVKKYHALHHLYDIDSIGAVNKTGDMHNLYLMKKKINKQMRRLQADRVTAAEEALKLKNITDSRGRRGGKLVHNTSSSDGDSNTNALEINQRQLHILQMNQQHQTYAKGDDGRTSVIDANMDTDTDTNSDGDENENEIWSSDSEISYAFRNYNNNYYGGSSDSNSDVSHDSIRSHIDDINEVDEIKAHVNFESITTA